MSAFYHPVSHYSTGQRQWKKVVKKSLDVGRCRELIKSDSVAKQIVRDEDRHSSHWFGATAQALIVCLQELLWRRQSHGQQHISHRAPYRKYLELYPSLLSTRHQVAGHSSSTFPADSQMSPGQLNRLPSHPFDQSAN